MLQPLNPPDTMETYTCGVEYMRNLGYGMEAIARAT